MMQFFAKKKKKKKGAAKAGSGLKKKKRKAEDEGVLPAAVKKQKKKETVRLKPAAKARQVKTLAEILGNDDTETNMQRKQGYSTSARSLREELAKPVNEFELTLHEEPSFTEFTPVFKYGDAVAKRDELRQKKEAKRQAQLDRLAALSQDAEAFLAKERKKEVGNNDGGGGMPDVFMSSTFNIGEDVATYCEGLVEPLWLTPEESGPFKRKNPRKYPIYDTKTLNKTRRKYLRLPRAYGVSCFPDAHPDWHAKLLSFVKEAPGIKLFNGNLLPYQEKATAHVLRMLKELHTHSGLLEAACGSGKTVMALYICSMLGIPAAIVVHTDTLLKQWVQRAKQFLPNAKIGICQGAKRPAEDCDICICMLQTVMKLNNTSFLDRYGIVVFDETHHIAAESFSKAARAFVAPYVLGLSATLMRGDGLHYSIDWLIGPKLVRIKRISTAVEVLPVRYTNPDFEHATMKHNEAQMDYVLTITKLVSDAWRTRRMAEVIWELATREERCVIVICKRVQLAKDLHALLPGSGLYAGSSKKKAEVAKREAAKSKRVILASQALAAEGLDVAFLDTVVLGTPIKVTMDDDKDISQIIGRVQRGYSRKRPLVVDFYDNYQMFAGMFRARRRYYAENQYFFRRMRKVDVPQVVETTVLKAMLQNLKEQTGIDHGEEKQSREMNQGQCKGSAAADVTYDAKEPAPNQVESRAHLRKLVADVLYKPFPPLAEMTPEELQPSAGRGAKKGKSVKQVEDEITEELIQETTKLLNKQRSREEEADGSSELFAFLGMKRKTQ